MSSNPFAPMPGTKPFSDPPGDDYSGNQNLLHAIRGGAMGGNEYRVQNMPRAAVYRNAVQTITSGVLTVISWDTLEYDTDGMWSAAAPTRLTCRTPGIYTASGEGGFAAAVAGYRAITFMNNGVGYTYGNTVFYDRDGVTCNISMSAIMRLQAGDYVELACAQTSGGNLNFSGAAPPARLNYMQLCMISTL